MNGQAETLDSLFATFDQCGLLYCVLHSAENLPFSVFSDLDIAVSGTPIDRVEEMIASAVSATGWSTVQRLWYDVPSCYYYVLRSSTGNHWLAVDVLIDETGIGRYGLSSRELVADREKRGPFYVASPSTEFCYKLIKRVRKGQLAARDSSLLEDLFSKASKSRVLHLLTPHFGVAGSRNIVRNMAGGVERFLTRRQLRKLGVRQLIFRRYLDVRVLSARLVSHFRRLYSRLRCPTGICLICASTCRTSEARIDAENLQRTVGKAFRRVRHVDRLSRLRVWLALSSCTLLIHRVRRQRDGFTILGTLHGFRAWRALADCDDMETLEPVDAIVTHLHRRLPRTLRPLIPRRIPEL